MPDEALPVHRPIRHQGVRFTRLYADALERPFTGTVTFTGTVRHESPHRVILPVSVTVPLVDGVVDIHLPADTYTVSAMLKSADRDTTFDNDTITLEQH